MTTPFEDLYLPDQSEPAGVFSFGRSADQITQDLEAGIARIGGFGRSPNYGQAYLVAANTLLRKATEDRALDHHGLPIFYLQRHAAELIMKGPLQLALEIQRYCLKLGEAAPNFPQSEEQRERAEGSHNLQALLADLEVMARVMRVGGIPDALRTAVGEINALEQHRDTWSRYSFSSVWENRKAKKKKVIQHADQEVILPLGRIQNLLQTANDSVGSIFPFAGSIMGQLGGAYHSLLRKAKEIY